MENKAHKLCKEERDEIQAIKNTLRKYDEKMGIADSFWESFNSSRCKTAMLIISIVVVLIWGVTIVAQIPNEELTVIVMGIIGFWSGRSTKVKDHKID
jgi:hypothetical protein